MKTKEILSADRLRRAAHSAIPQTVFEIIYYLYLITLTVITYLNTTMYTLVISERMLDFITISVILLAFAKSAADRPWTLWEILAGVFMAGAIAWSWNREARTFMLETAALILGARGMSFEKILKIYLLALIPAFIFSIAEAMLGRIDNLIYTRPTGETRIAFGSVYPTDFCAHIVFLTCSIAWLRERRLTYIEIAVIVGLAFFCYYFCDARTSAICLVVLALGLLYIKLRRRIAQRRGKEYRMNRLLSGVLCFGMPIAAVFMILLSYVYDESIPVFATINRLLSGRLTYSHAAFSQYNITLFGQYVYMRGLGGSLQHAGEYFFLDSSYINMFFRFGILPLCGVIAIMVIGCRRQRKNLSWERLGILTLIALHCMIEHHLFELAYDPFLLMLFAVSNTDRQAARFFPARKRKGKKKGSHLPAPAAE